MSATVEIRQDEGRWTVNVDDLPALRSEAEDLDDAVAEAVRRALTILQPEAVRRMLLIIRDVMEAFEEQLDLRAAREALDEPGESVPWEQVKATLQR